MTTYNKQMIEALRKSLDVAVFHQSCLDHDVSESIRKEHEKHVASKRRALNKAIKSVGV